jgi:hypothetical protein
MPLTKVLYKNGVNRENTRYTTEGGWYVSDKVRFRQGTPEKIGGWVRISANTFLGVCRALWNWATLGGQNLMGVGTNLKYYIEQGGAYNDITPIRTRNYTTSLSNPFDTTNTSTLVTVNDTAHGAQAGDLVYFSGATAVGGVPAAELNTRHVITSITSANAYVITVTTAATSTVTGGGGTVAVEYYINTFELGADPFATTNGSPVVVVTANSHGAINGDFVTFSGATAVAGLTINGEYQLTYINANSYSITASSNANATTTGGGSAVLASYQINTGPAVQVPVAGWGAGAWGLGAWGVGTTSLDSLRLWSANNFGEDLVYGPRGGNVYYWDASTSVTTRGVAVETLPGAVDPPIIQNFIFVSDTYRFVICFGTNDVGSSTQDPMLIRWSDQESVVDWLPAATNQAGSIRLSHGSEIITALQTRQEIVVWTDTSIYSLQYLGAPLVWGSQLLGDNISIIGPNAVAVGSGIVFWMGKDKFYVYSGRVETLNCDLRKYVFSDINLAQNEQVFAGTNEGFNEIWWFYCSSNSTTINRYVVYNYAEKVWHYGTMARTAWIDVSLRDYPQAATYSYNLVSHELGNDDNETGTPVAINAYIESSEFDIQDGHNLGFVYRVLPDLTFTGSTSSSPQVTMTLIPMMNSGSGYNNPQSVSGSSSATVARTSTSVIEQFTGQVYVRVRGRQMIFKIESTDLGSAWQLGAPRIDIRPDGRATGRGA